ncbi:ribosome assembly cofactor RimP [Mesomycoplasma ovipneumoniae]|uniref:ribosome assembly cofactor RimP n=1 Tax=Mesomycoplasma ovipneumoniae TaxID=29562 RepID=UPI0026E19A6D|nr:ribosome assembly cofactor RimP [Mesomycoplasma ovipneumoniae]MDO6822058.1 ribosome assembly cofactor RimP [Mesomycoplasma ovipneumoniae]MDO6855719.1 ribosome assembly cofactor RimP [Mesomycoplasma ovipneumoniae]
MWRLFCFKPNKLIENIEEKGENLNLIQRLKDEFNDILSINFVLEDGLNYLRVVTNYNSLDQVEAISKKISEFIDKIESSENNFILEVLSRGQDCQDE